MARTGDIIRTADICDDHGDDVRVCELQFRDYAGREHFHGEVETFATFEDNKGILDVLKAGGAGRVLVIDGRGSLRRALCGGNIAEAAFKQGWEGLVFNGAIRDSHEFAELDFGVKALGTTAMPPRRGAGGRAGEALNFGGVAINSGDYLYADRDAVILLPGPVHG